jgi:hypothetical protein
MGIDTWLATTSGDWTDAANWSAGLPGPGDVAVFPGTVALTVTFDTTVTIDALQGGTNETLAITGGELTLSNAGPWAGTVDATGGTIDVLNSTFGISDLTMGAGATAFVQQDAALSATGTGTIGGFIGGSGRLALANSGTFTLAPGLTLANTLLLAVGAFNTTVSLGGDLALDGIFAFSGGATLALDGHNLTLDGPDLLGGFAIGPGTISTVSIWRTAPSSRTPAHWSRISTSTSTAAPSPPAG